MVEGKMRGVCRLCRALFEVLDGQNRATLASPPAAGAEGLGRRATCATDTTRIRGSRSGSP